MSSKYFTMAQMELPLAATKIIRNRLQVGIELVAPWSANRDLQARDDIIGNILQLLHDGTDGIAMSRDENSFGIGLRSASTS